MPIRINLLAEAQVTEDLRRRDPVKRFIAAGVLLVIAALVWSSWLQVKATMANSNLSQVQAQIATKTNEYQRVVADLKKVSDINAKLDALQKLSTNRFLQGNLLNALQQTPITGIQFARVRLDQSYIITEGTPAQKDNNGKRVPGRPGQSMERIQLTLDARDSSFNPGDQVNKFKDALGEQPYFKEMLIKTNAVRLSNLSAPQPGLDGKTFVLFTLECSFPDKTR